MTVTPMPAPDSGVTVRMYRAGLGDCFLLAFRGEGGQPVYMLIDCGVHSQYKGGSDLIRTIVDHIRTSTGDHLHVVVVTHEHGDHISGFELARDRFDEMTIDEVWFAWTENTDEYPLAGTLDRARSLMMQGLETAEPALASAGDPAAKTIGGLMGFFGIGDLPLSSRKARNAIRDQVDEDKRRYFLPKREPVTVNGVDGVRIFVLGPPHDAKKLLRARPSTRGDEVYREPDGQHFSADETLSAAYE